jgi:hypothetical protein
LYVQEEEDGRLYCVKMSLYQLLGFAAVRGNLVLRKVDFHTPGADWTAQGEKLEKLLDVLRRMWMGNPPALQRISRTLIWEANESSSDDEDSDWVMP